jgi:ABC-2 type transport system permease protein
MVFYVFYSGASSAETLLAEEEQGTLARIFSTPTPVRDVLGGRILATYVMEIVQVLVLLVSSALIFGVQWGRALPVGLVALGMIVLAASFGLFLTSLLRSTRQGGLIYGGLMTILGMVGMIGIFGLTSANAPRATMEIASLFTPQGWAVKAWLLLLDGGGSIDVLPTAGVMLLLGAVFFALGLLRFRKRFA